MSEERKGLTGSLLKGLTGKAVEALAVKMGLTPHDRGWVTVDVGASLMSVSPKVAMDFFKAAKEVSGLLDNGDLRAWADRVQRGLPGGSDVRWVCELKIDGTAINCVYRDGRLDVGATRGTGVVGETVT